MMLYTDDVKTMLGGVTDAQLESTFAAAIASSTEALTNSDIDAEFRLVFVGPVRFLTQIFRPFSEGTVSRVISFGFRCTFGLVRLVRERKPSVYLLFGHENHPIDYNKRNKHQDEVTANCFVVT